MVVRLVVGILAIHLWTGPAHTEEKTLPLKGEEIGSFIVRVRGNEGLLPKRATVKPGTTVIWFNQTRDYIEIAFTSDQKVDVACKVPVHFVLGMDRTYVSDKIPFAAVASLCFIEKGTYKYSVRSFSDFRTAEQRETEKVGYIIVED